MNPLTKVILSRIKSGLSVTPVGIQLSLSDLDQDIVVKDDQIIFLERIVSKKLSAVEIDKINRAWIMKIPMKNIRSMLPYKYADDDDINNWLEALTELSELHHCCDIILSAEEYNKGKISNKQ